MVDLAPANTLSRSLLPYDLNLTIVGSLGVIFLVFGIKLESSGNSDFEFCLEFCMERIGKFSFDSLSEIFKLFYGSSAGESSLIFFESLLINSRLDPDIR